MRDSIKKKNKQIVWNFNGGHYGLVCLWRLSESFSPLWRVPFAQINCLQSCLARPRPSYRTAKPCPHPGRVRWYSTLPFKICTINILDLLTNNLLSLQGCRVCRGRGGRRKLSKSQNDRGFRLRKGVPWCQAGAVAFPVICHCGRGSCWLLERPAFILPLGGCPPPEPNPFQGA